MRARLGEHTITVGASVLRRTRAIRRRRAASGKALQRVKVMMARTSTMCRTESLAARARESLAGCSQRGPGTLWRCVALCTLPAITTSHIQFGRFAGFVAACGLRVFYVTELEIGLILASCCGFLWVSRSTFRWQSLRSTRPMSSRFATRWTLSWT